MSETDRSLESKTISEVKASTKMLLDSFKAKMDQLKTKGPQVNSLLRFGVDLPAASATAKRMFGDERTRYIAIDGTESVDQQLDLLIFYVGAFAYSGTVGFYPGGVLVGEPQPEQSGLSVSAAIPLSEDEAASVYGKKHESGVEVDQERLPNSLMHLAEYYLACRSLTSDRSVRVVLLDRTLAGDVSHLVWSTKDRVAGHGCVLEKMHTSRGEVTAFDLELARILIANDALLIPAPRSHLLKFAAVRALFKGDSLSVPNLIERVGGTPGRVARLEADLEHLQERYDIFESFDGKFKLKSGIPDYWERTLEAALAVSSHVFNPSGGHPLFVPREGGGVWVTADDLDFLVLVFIQAILRLAWERNVLPIGFIKDTNASELVNSAIPILDGSRLVGDWAPLPDFRSDKMLLQTNSVVNAPMVPTPWHTFDFDASFRTMAPKEGQRGPKGQLAVDGAYGNIIYPERVFVKTYLQLWSSHSSPEIRSHVFTVDRPTFPGYDHWDEVSVVNRDGAVEEEISPVLHFKKGSEVTNMVMAMLVEMGSEVIPEALGHNYPLFLADKKAKSVLQQTKAAYLGAVAIELARSNLDQQVLFSRRFRDYRTQMEGSRKS